MPVDTWDALNDPQIPPTTHYWNVEFVVVFALFAFYYASSSCTCARFRKK